MKKNNLWQEMNNPQTDSLKNERGAATLISVLIMALLAIFVTVALSRVTTEALITGNDDTQSRTFYAAQASLEWMTRRFNEKFENSLVLTSTAQNDLQNTPPIGFPSPRYQFNQTVTSTGGSRVVTILGGTYNNLIAIQTPWQLQTTVTGPNNVQAQLTRNIFSNEVPLFQFGIFYDHDMDFWPGPTMQVSGRVHTNGNLFLCGNGGLTFYSVVSSAKEIVHDNARNGGAMFNPDNVFVTNGAGGYPQFTQGSVTNGPNVGGNQSDEFAGTTNANWNTFSSTFNGNLLANTPPLKMPLQTNANADPIEIIKRGTPGENGIIAGSRYFNKPAIRVSVNDSQAQLPGGTGGVRLDGASVKPVSGLWGKQDANSSRGYQPLAMTGSPAYTATRVNGHRLYTGADYSGDVNGRQTWIKVELVTPNLTDPSTPTVVDITEDFLSLGVTEDDTLPKFGGGTVSVGDSRAIIKLQRFAVHGPPIKVTNINDMADLTAAPTSAPDPRGGSKPTFAFDIGSSVSYVTDANLYMSTAETYLAYPSSASVALSGDLLSAHKAVPFPIEMYDVREGLYNAELTPTQWATAYPNGVIPSRGVMSLVDIDVANLRQFMSGTWDGKFPKGLTSAQVPLDSNGLILYVSDRRGDADNDGVYDMEDIYVNSPSDTTSGLQAGEDLFGGGFNNLQPDNVLQADYTWESCPFNTVVSSDVAAVTENAIGGGVYTNGHRYYRRAVRLINGKLLPNPTVAGGGTGGFTLASENGVYVLGDYNATGANAPGSLPTPPSGYFNALGPMVGSSVVGDAVTILSNSWNDGGGFRNPFTMNSTLGLGSGRKANDTTVRTALLVGTTKSSLLTTPNQGGVVSGTGGTLKNSDGGVNNFPRLLEDWNTSGARLNYCGSMIALYYSRNNNGSFKGTNGNPNASGSAPFVETFLAPNRNWTFDTNFQTPALLPPGTPFLQFVQITGFRRTNF